MALTSLHSKCSSTPPDYLSVPQLPTCVLKITSSWPSDIVKDYGARCLHCIELAGIFYVKMGCIGLLERCMIKQSRWRFIPRKHEGEKLSFLKFYLRGWWSNVLHPLKNACTKLQAKETMKEIGVFLQTHYNLRLMGWCWKKRGVSNGGVGTLLSEKGEREYKNAAKDMGCCFRSFKDLFV